MDTLTHALSGALLARATESHEASDNKLPRHVRMGVGALAAAFPDSDFVLRFIDPLVYLTSHRGVTHSVLLLPMWALGLALVFSLLWRHRYPWRAFVGMCALGIGIHIAGDIITSFGTMIFSPLSDQRVALPLTFIIDPYFSAIIVVGLIASAYWKSSRRPAVAALLLLIAYVGAQGWLHQQARDIAETHAKREQLESATVYALPQPFSPFHWMLVVADANAYRLTYISLTRRDMPTGAGNASWWRRLDASYLPVAQAQWKTVPRFFGSAEQISLARDLWQSPAFTGYRHFALLPALYRVDERNDEQCVWFNDLRFAMTGREMPFRYGACRSRAATQWTVLPLAENTAR